MRSGLLKSGVRIFTGIKNFHLTEDKLRNMFRLADIYFEDRDIDKEFRKIFLHSFHPIKKRKITQKIEGTELSKATVLFNQFILFEYD